MSQPGDDGAGGTGPWWRQPRWPIVGGVAAVIVIAVIVGLVVHAQGGSKGAAPRRTPVATPTPHVAVVAPTKRARPTATAAPHARATATATATPHAPRATATATAHPRPTAHASATPRTRAAATATPVSVPAPSATVAPPTQPPAATATSRPVPPVVRATATPASVPMATATRRALIPPVSGATATPLPPQPSATPRPSATATPLPSPTPRTLAAAYPDYEVGAYYFSGWSHGQNDNITALLTGPKHASEPLIGWYDDSQAQVDKNIAQAYDAGIDFFAFDWYDIAKSPYPTDKTLNEGLGFFLTSHTPQRQHMKFCLNFIDQAPFIPSAADWSGLINKWIPYFRNPDYLRVNGKPLFIVFSPEHMRDIFGGSPGVRRALDLLRARVKAAGLPGVTIAIAATVAPHVNPIHVQELNAEGYDVATGYNYHSMGNEQYRIPVPYQDLVNENTAMWDRVAERVHVPYIPVITSGWDQRYSAREQATAIIYAGRTPQKFTCYAVQARHWIDTHPAQTVKEHVVMVFAWNEIGEGGSIIPNHQDGYAYANAVRTVFGGPGQAPSTPAYCK